MSGKYTGALASFDAVIEDVERQVRPAAASLFASSA